jgi:hypothetical protein
MDCRRCEDHKPCSALQCILDSKRNMNSSLLRLFHLSLLCFPSLLLGVSNGFTVAPQDAGYVSVAGQAYLAPDYVSHNLIP